jgi:hypothetical protein
MEQSPSWEVCSFSASHEIPPSFYGMRSYTTVLTRACHWSLSWARLTQSTAPHPISLTLWSNNNSRLTFLKVGVCVCVCVCVHTKGSTSRTHNPITISNIEKRIQNTGYKKRFPINAFFTKRRQWTRKRLQYAALSTTRISTTWNQVPVLSAHFYHYPTQHHNDFIALCVQPCMYMLCVYMYVCRPTYPYVSM